MNIAHYTIYCLTDSKWEDWYLPETDPEPTACPVDSGHAVTGGSVSVVGTIGPDAVEIKNDTGEIVNWPMTDGTNGRTPIYQPSIVPAGYYLYLTGAFDNVGAGTRGDGALLALERDGVGQDVVEGQFLEHVYVLGGAVGSLGASYDDWVSMQVHAPASAPADRTGTHDGNANKVPTGYGFNIIVPAPLGDGDWNVDGAVFTAGEINTGLSPVPADAGNGYWNWNPDLSPSIFPVGNPAAPNGSYNLFDVQLDLVRQANRLSCLIPGDIAPGTLKGKKILPHWVCKFIASRTSQAGILQTACRMTLARKKTT